MFHKLQGLTGPSDTRAHLQRRGASMADHQSPPKDQTTSERIAAHLRDAILRGEIAPGSRIRQEEVAERLGTSRLPVREALRILEAEGLTEHTANKGARVPRLDPAELDVLYRMRERLEPLALTESLPHLSDADIAELADIHERIMADDDLGE